MNTCFTERGREDEGNFYCHHCGMQVSKGLRHRQISSLTDIAKTAAKILAGADWHRLSPDEQKLVKQLTSAMYLTSPSPANGFVGKVREQL